MLKSQDNTWKFGKIGVMGPLKVMMLFYEKENKEIYVCECVCDFAIVFGRVLLF